MGDNKCMIYYRDFVVCFKHPGTLTVMTSNDNCDKSYNLSIVWLIQVYLHVI